MTVYKKGKYCYESFVSLGSFNFPFDSRCNYKSGHMNGMDE